MARHRGDISTFWDREDIDYQIFATFTPGKRGNSYGPPEACYPSEAAEAYITEVLRVEEKTEVPVDLKEFLASLSKNEFDGIQSRLIMAGDERAEELHDEAGDRQYDDMRERDWDDRPSRGNDD